MNSTRPPQQNAGGALPQPTDTPSREPTLIRNPSIDLESAGLADMSAGVDAFASPAPIVGKTINIANMQPIAYHVPPCDAFPDGIRDSIDPSTLVGAKRAPRSLADTLLRRPQPPMWVESEMLGAHYAASARRAMSGRIFDAPGLQPPLPTGEIRYVTNQVAPSSLYMSHFGAAVVAAGSRGDNNMQALRILPTINTTSDTDAPIQHCTVVLYANTGDDKLEPVAINTDSRVPITQEGDLRAMQRVPMYFDLTYPVLESAFAKLIAAGAAYAFKPFNPLYRATNADAMGHALTAVTGSPTSVTPLADLSQEALATALADRHAAVILTFAPDQELPVRTGDVPQAQWVTYQSTPKASEVAAGLPLPQHTFLADVPYVVTQFYPKTGHVELVNVLKQSFDPTWYEEDAKGIHQALAHQTTPTFRVPLELLRRNPGAQLFSSKIAYATPITLQQQAQPVGTDAQGRTVVAPVVRATLDTADVASQKRVRDNVTAKLFEGARGALTLDQHNQGIEQLMGMSKVEVKDDLITLHHVETDAPIAHLLRAGVEFCWFVKGADVALIRQAIQDKTAEVSTLRECLAGIAREIGLTQAPQETAYANDAKDVQPSVARVLAPAVPPTPTPALVAPIFDATLASLRDPGVPTRIVGNDIAIENLTPQERASLQVVDDRAWYNKLLNRNPDSGWVVDSSALSQETLATLGTFKPQANSIHFQTLTPDLVAPSRIQTSHFAAAITAVAAVGGEGLGRFLTLRSLAQTPPDAEGSQIHTVVLYTGQAQDAEKAADTADASSLLVPTPISVTNAVFTAADGTVRAMRAMPPTDSPERMAHEGSLPFHGYAVLENAFQKLAAHASQYIFKPFESQDDWDNASAISHTLSAITGNPTHVTQLVWDGSKDNSQAWWPAKQDNADIALLTFPSASELPTSAAFITSPTPFADTPSLLIEDDENDAAVLSNIPYAVTGMLHVGDGKDPSQTRVLLHNVLAISDDPSWYQKDAPSLAKIIARQSVAPLPIQPGQENRVKKMLLSVSLEALQRVGATVYTSPLRAEPIATPTPAAGEAPPNVRAIRYDDAQLMAMEGVRDVIAQLAPTPASTAFKTWAATLSFTSDTSQQAQTLLQVRKGGAKGEILTTFVRTVPEQRMLPRDAEALLPRYNALNAQFATIQGSLNRLQQAMREGKVHPAQAQIDGRRLQAQLAAIQPEGAAIEQRITQAQIQAALAKGGVRRIQDGVLGTETTLLELLQGLFAEQQGAA